MDTFRCCAIVPTYNNPKTVTHVIQHIRRFITDVIVVDDGSDAQAQRVCEQIAIKGMAQLVRFSANRGKGAATKYALQLAQQQGFSHGFQIDADAQHDLAQIPYFLQAAQQHPDCAIFAYPIYDTTVPKSRLWGRKLTKFWVDLEVGGAGIVQDAMIGFRVYPLPLSTKLKVVADRMDFEVEITVRLVWAKVPIINLPVAVRYLTEAEGGCSHFQLLRDNLRLGWLHCRLCSSAATCWCLRKLHLLPRLGSP